MQAGVALLDAAGFSRNGNSLLALRDHTQRDFIYLNEAAKQFQTSARNYLRIYTDPQSHNDPTDVMEKYLGMSEFAAIVTKELATYRLVDGVRVLRRGAKVSAVPAMTHSS
jgi:hypothetical protein